MDLFTNMHLSGTVPIGSSDENDCVVLLPVLVRYLKMLLLKCFHLSQAVISVPLVETVLQLLLRVPMSNPWSLFLTMFYVWNSSRAEESICDLWEILGISLQTEF